MFDPFIQSTCVSHPLPHAWTHRNTLATSSAFLHPLGAPDIDNLWGQSFAVLRQGGVKNGSIFSPISGQYVNLAVRLSCVSFVPFFTCAFVLGGSGGGFPI
ncbi:hypothetical protein H2248_012582 [Termitomyces sp. 'cryptogamus']|nr:hypothetical protein H2248_012582 [Termitomyces sp. 'cryptogamus']